MTDTALLTRPCATSSIAFNGRSVRRIPSAAPDRDTVSDQNGNLYEFNQDDKSWILKGVELEFDIVTEQDDGLVSPEILKRINLIKSLQESGISFERSKIFVGNGSDQGYFALFHSNDNSVRFKSELSHSSKRLRMEVNKPSIIKKLRKFSCRGPKGPTGAKGQSGPRADRPPDEQFEDPEIVDGRLVLRSEVESSIDTPISLRLFRNSVQKVDIRIPLDDSDQTLQIDTDDDIEIDLTRTVVEFQDGILTAVIALIDDEFDDSWEFKARQVGLKGPRGNDGRTTLGTTSGIFDDRSIRFKSAISSIRIESKNLIFGRIEPSSTTCVPALSHITDIPINNIEKEHLIAVELVTRACKNLGFFKFLPKDFQQDLTLPQWTPRGCTDIRRRILSVWNWMSTIQDPSLPFNIEIDPEPEAVVCKDNFFHCPDLGQICPEPRSSSTASSDSVGSESSRSAVSESTTPFLPPDPPVGTPKPCPSSASETSKSESSGSEQSVGGT